jgi:hypothetical protein
MSHPRIGGAQFGCRAERPVDSRFRMAAIGNGSALLRRSRPQRQTQETDEDRQYGEATGKPRHFASPLLILARIAHMGLATVPIVIGATGLDPTEPHLACHRRLCEARLTIRLRKEARGPASALKQQCATSKPCASITQAASASAPIGSYNFSWR